MTALQTSLPLAAAARPAAAATPLGLRIGVGLVGVLLAVLASGFNENVTKVAMADIRGAMGLSYDQGTWLIAAYAAMSVSAMAFAPWCAVTFSLRRFTLCAIGSLLVLALLAPFAPNTQVLMLIRVVQGFAGGALPPMLMSVALRFLPPGIKLYGLGGYALTATFGPSFGTPLAAWWVEYAGWQWAFWQVIPLGLVAMACVAWGIPQDPLRLERLRQFDWRGLLLGFPGLVMLVLGLQQGERLGWFDAQLIRVLVGGGLLLLVLFFINEWAHPLPFFKLQMLGIRNLTHALVTLGGVLFVLLAVIMIPSSYLAQVQGYRPLQTAPVLLWVAVPQLLALPLVVALCNNRVVDCRWVLATGLFLLALVCVIGSQVTVAWNRENFYLLQAIQIVAQPMAVIPLLMLSTGSITPADGPFASAWFNTVKGFAAVAAGSLLETLTVRREHFHSSHLVDRLGSQPWLADSVEPGQLAHRLHEQVVTLTSADLYLCVAGLAIALILLIPILPTRIYPPRAAA
ncbi:arabinose efflux permease family protein [Pseudomonas asplenii]|uniref:Arabinose efflux permease family protein n=1 Tax=Pseudomonas asplenii TaxID=53407 RepID=A0A0M9GHS1_9PSED|nr:MFS transporter [Pseudomonas fuscovaginae]KPA91303.1 arabinose efflux permease family protein [Pseudomonas fuscovaginae]